MRALRTLLCLGVVWSVVAAATASASPHRLKSPRASEISRAGRITDTTLSARGAARLAAAGYWGGDFVASTGEHVHLFVSSTYPEDPAVAQKWVELVAGFLHGAELPRLTAYLGTLREVQRTCGFEALACYSPRAEVLYAPAENASASISAESVVAHEYGHHVARNRSNRPWEAIRWGTKRWASYEHVCMRAREGVLFPGAEDESHYARNPGEAFAETYRVLNERRLPLPASPWSVVTPLLLPDDAALAAVEQDVAAPWTLNTTTRFTGSVGPRGTRTRIHGIETPLDGSLQATVRFPAGRRVTLELVTGGKVVGRAASRSGTATARTTVCGQRSYAVRVTAPTGVASTYALAVSRP